MNLNDAQIGTLRAASRGDLYRTTLGNYRISGQNGFCPSAHNLEQAGLLEQAGDMGTFLDHRARLVQGETIRPTTVGLEVLASLTVHTTRAA